MVPSHDPKTEKVNDQKNNDVLEEFRTCCFGISLGIFGKFLEIPGVDFWQFLALFSYFWRILRNLWGILGSFLGKIREFSRKCQDKSKISRKKRKKIQKIQENIVFSYSQSYQVLNSSKL